MTLIELAGFLLARIAEDETVARKSWARHDGLVSTLTRDPDAGVLAWPSRVLAECDAKRRIVQSWKGVPNLEGDPYSQQVQETAGHVFRCLALPYADHPDYRQEWKP